MSDPHEPSTPSPLSRVSVGVKILSGVLVAGAGMLAIAVFAFVHLGAMRDAQTALQQRAVSPLAVVAELRRAYLQTRIDALTDLWIDSTNGAAYQAYTADKAQMTSAVEELERVAHTPVQREQVAKLKTAWQTYVKAVDDPALKAAARSNNVPKYAALRAATIAPSANVIYDTTEKIRLDVEAQVKAQMAASQATYDQSWRLLGAVFLVAILLSTALGVIATRAVTRPLRRLGDVCAAVAKGDLTRTVDLSGSDEVCRVAQALDVATTSTRGAVTLLASSASSVAGTTGEIAVVADHIATASQETTARAQQATQAAEDIARGVHAVAAGAEQMSASIQEIARNTSEAATLGTHARQLADGASTTMNKLGDSSAGIGNVIQVITTIAEQTNLLALNATIEAARAGEAGRGFAVVASEVKDLAQETAKATKEIGALVEAIQQDSADAVEAIAGISEVVSRLDTVQATIASAVEQQSATTAEMSRSVAEASGRTNDIVANIAAVTASAVQTTETVTMANAAVDSLSTMASGLEGAVTQFTL